MKGHEALKGDARVAKPLGQTLFEGVKTSSKASEIRYVGDGEASDPLGQTSHPRSRRDLRENSSTGFVRLADR